MCLQLKSITLAVFASFCTVCIGTAKDSEPRLSLITVGTVQQELRDRVVSFVEEQYLVRPVIGSGISDAPDSLKQLKALLVQRVQAHDVALLALCAAPGIPHEGMVFKEERCGAINLSALKPSDEDSDDQAERFARRVEKESLRAIALVVGIEPCPFPRCALRAHANDRELDFKSRNPCPPCLAKVQSALQAKGLKPVNEPVPEARE